jgi:glyoxylase-like metal-dependent hydrolase (beta-lactamase superfamily II)
MNVADHRAGRDPSACTLPRVATTFAAAPRIQAIDTLMCGREKATSAYLVEAAEPALVETGPTTSLPAVLEGLGRLGVGRHDLAHIVVTHIHLDHAGGAGALAPHFPNATLWVHERGAPHLADPTRLVESAIRVYGEERLRAMFGSVDPAPVDRLRAVTDGEVIELGGRSLEVVYTPGHAGHHVCLLDSETRGIFVGDALGVFLPDVKLLRPASPPPEFDLELAISSIERIRSLDPSIILFSHFGPAPEVSHLTALAIRRLREWTDVVERAMRETDDVAQIVERLRAGTAAELNALGGGARQEIQDRYELLSSYEINAMGLIRYLTNRGSP